MDFNDLRPEDYSDFKKFFKNSSYELSYYSLSSVFLWDNCLFKISAAVRGDFLLLAETVLENKDKKRLMLPVSAKTPSPAELKEILLETGFRHYYYVPEDYLKTHKKDLGTNFNIYEQSDCTDYVYKTADLAELQGRKYAKKRNLISQFERNYVRAGRVQTLVLDRTNIADITDFLDYWAKENPDNALIDMIECEQKAVKGALRYWEEYELFGVSVYLDGKMAGFAIASRLNANTADLNFEKGNKKIKGLYQFLDREFARIASPTYLFINKESDLGKPNLARAKESYYPVKKIRSYILELK